MCQVKTKIFIHEFEFFTIPTIHRRITMGLDMSVVVVWEQESKAAFQGTFDSRSYLAMAV